MMERLARYCLRRGGLVAAITAGLVVLSLAQLSRAELSSDLVALFVADGPDADAYRRWRALFDAAEPAVLGIPSDAPLSPDSLTRLRSLERDLRATDGVASVLSLASAPRVADEGGLLRVETWGEALARAEGPSRERLVVEVMADEELVGTFVGRGGDALLVMVQLDEAFAERPPAEQLALEQRLRDAVADSGLATAKDVRAVGFPVVVSMMLEISVTHLRTLVPLAALVLILVVLLFYRRLWPALFACVIAGVSVIFAGAAAIAYDVRITPMHSIAPVLIIVISLADTIFVLNAFSRARQAGLEDDDAIVRAIGEVGPACVLTSISTFFSFATFLLIPASAMQLLGIAAGVGVASALLLIVTLGPVLLHTLPTPAVGSGRRTRAFVDGLVDVTRRIAIRHPRVVVSAALIALVGAGAATTQLEVETDWARRMAPEHRLPQAETWIKDRFGGFSTVEAVWRTSDDALAPEVLAAQAAFRARALARDDVLQELSAASVLMTLKRALTGTERAEPPADKAEVAQLLLLAEGAGDPLAMLVSDDRTAARSILRVRPTGLRKTAKLADDLEAAARAGCPAGVHVEVTGLAVMQGSWLDKMLRAQVRGLGLVALMSVLVLALGLRSVRAGVFALLPNSLPVLLFLGLLALPGAHFDSDYLLVCVVGLGIAVDDTIHFLTRFRAASRAGMDTERALQEAYLSAGPAMVETTLILVVGLSPLVLSDYLGARMFFTELSKVLVGALVADLLLLPAMIRLGWIRFDAHRPARVS